MYACTISLAVSSSITGSISDEVSVETKLFAFLPFFAAGCRGECAEGSNANLLPTGIVRGKESVPLKYKD